MAEETNHEQETASPVERLKCRRTKTKDGCECAYFYLLRLRGTRKYKCCKLRNGFCLAIGDVSGGSRLNVHVTDQS